MNENEVRRIALSYVKESNIDPCSIMSVRRFSRTEITEPSTEGDKWVVQFKFDDEDDDASSDWMIIIVDDTTGEAIPFESL